MDLLPDEAQRIILNHVKRGSEETVPVGAAFRRVLALPAVAAEDLPGFAQSAMDGYALAATATAAGVQPAPMALPPSAHSTGPLPAGAFPARAGERFALRGVSRAGGGMPGALAPGQAMRIFTGAPVPQGAVAIAMQEIVRVDGDHVTLLEAVPPGRFIRPAGSDVAAGQEALSAGEALGPAALTLLKALGISQVTVHRAPRVCLVASGDELCVDRSERQPGQVIETTSHALRWALREEGLDLAAVRYARDTQESHERELSASLKECDVLLVTGGVSVGDYDLVRPVLTDRLGVEPVFWKVRQRPGGPLFFGRRDSRLVFGIPGNPASTLVCFFEHVLPALRRFLGHASPCLPRVTATLAGEIRKPAAKTHFVRARVGPDESGALAVFPDPQQESHTLRSFATASALAVLPAGRERFEAGTQVACDLLPGMPFRSARVAAEEARS